MIGVFAEFEREIIRERVCAGLEKARAKGRRLGRPRVSASIEAEIRAARQTGKGQLAIARDLHVGISTVRRVLGADAEPRRRHHSMEGSDPPASNLLPEIPRPSAAFIQEYRSPRQSQEAKRRAAHTYHSLAPSFLSRIPPIAIPLAAPGG